MWNGVHGKLAAKAGMGPYVYMSAAAVVDWTEERRIRITMAGIVKPPVFQAPFPITK